MCDQEGERHKKRTNTEDMYMGSRDGMQYQLTCPGENAGCEYMLDVHGSYLDIRPGTYAEKSASCSVFPRSSYSWYQTTANRSADTMDEDNIASGSDLPSQIVVIDAVEGHAVDLSALGARLQVETE